MRAGGRVDVAVAPVHRVAAVGLQHSSVYAGPLSRTLL